MFYGMSFDELRNRIFAALNPGERHDRWVRELYADHAIIEVEGGDLYSYPYSVDEEGEVTLGAPTCVEVDYVQAKLVMSLKAGDAPKEIQVIPFGVIESTKGTFILDEEGMDAIIAAFDASKNDMVIDYEHQTMYGQEAPAAGWIKKLVNKGKKGLWAIVEWTPRAAEYLKNREYRYLSPVIRHIPDTGRIMALVNAAITNQPAIDGMVPVVAKQDVQTHKKEERKMLKKIIKLLALKDDATEEQVMEALKALAEDAGQFAALKETLGLKAEASAEEVKTAVAAMKEGGVIVVAHKDVLDALGLEEGATLSTVTGTIMAMKQGSGQATELATRVKDLETKLRTREAEDLVEQAMKDGKVTPAQKEYFLGMAKEDPEKFRAYVKIAAKQFEPGEIAGGGGPVGGGGIEETQLAVNKALGIDEETFKKHNPAKE